MNRFVSAFAVGAVLVLGLPTSAPALPPEVESAIEIAQSSVTGCGVGGFRCPPGGAPGPVFVNYAIHIAGGVASPASHTMMPDDSAFPDDWYCDPSDDVVNGVYTVSCIPSRPPAAGYWACQGITVNVGVTGVNQVVGGNVACGAGAGCVTATNCANTAGAAVGRPDPFECVADYNQARLAVSWTVDCYIN